MKQLDPKAVWLFFISLSLRWLLIFLVLGVYFGTTLIFTFTEVKNTNVSLTTLNWLWIIVPVLLIIFFAWAKLTYHFYRYELTDVGFRKELGIVYKKYVTIPYDRIQNVDIYRGIWARILGLSDLNIQTAGASAVLSRYGAAGIGAEGRLPGLSREVAEQLRDELIQRARQTRNQGL
jgi:uncharacterized membrane protein YdbT with pleckstrin-like domain